MTQLSSKELFELGHQFFLKCKFNKALENFELALSDERPYPPAYLYLNRMYETIGMADSIDIHKSKLMNGMAALNIDWFEEKARSNDATAADLFHLGWCIADCDVYHPGRKNEAIRHLKAAIKFEDESCSLEVGEYQYQLGRCYSKARNPYIAFKHYQLSMENDFILGKISLGRCYDLGEGVKKNPVKALECYEQVQNKCPAMVQHLVNPDVVLFKELYNSLPVIEPLTHAELETLGCRGNDNTTPELQR